MRCQILPSKCKIIGNLIIRKIIKFVATRCQIIRLCTKFNFGWGSAPDPHTPLGELAAFPAEFRGPTFKGKGEGEKKRGRSRDRGGRKGEWDGQEWTTH